jgi:uncharacterized membrane protein HdeD (DUF308 family)
MNILDTKKSLPLYLNATIIILGGFFLLFSMYSTFNTLRITLGITLTIGGILSLFTAFSRQRKQVEFAYHEMHALAMLVYGVSVLLFCNKVETLIYFTSFLFYFYAFSEIIFCGWLFNLERKINYKIVFVRLLLGLMVGIGVVVILYYPGIEKKIDLEGFGLLFIIIGINTFLYVPVMKTKELKEAFG